MLVNSSLIQCQRAPGGSRNMATTWYQQEALVLTCHRNCGGLMKINVSCCWILSSFSSRKRVNTASKRDRSSCRRSASTLPPYDIQNLFYKRESGFLYMQDVNSQIYEPFVSANLSSSGLDFLNIAYLALCVCMSFSNAHSVSAKYLLRHPTFLPALRTISSQSPKYINYSMSIIVLHAALSKYYIYNCNKYIHTGYI